MKFLYTQIVYETLWENSPYNTLVTGLYKLVNVRAITLKSDHVFESTSSVECRISMAHSIWSGDRSNSKKIDPDSKTTWIYVKSISNPHFVQHCLSSFAVAPKSVILKVWTWTSSINHVNKGLCLILIPCFVPFVCAVYVTLGWVSPSQIWWLWRIFSIEFLT